MKNVSKSTNFIVKAAILSAAALLLAFLEFPVLPAYTFLKIDLSDIPALIGAFTFGPLAGALIEGLKNVLILIFKGTQTGGIGEFANFVIGCTFVCPAALIYRRNKTKRNAIVALIVSVIVIVIMGVASNYFIFIPLYFKNMPTKDLIHYLVYAIIPFNFIKGLLISIVTVLIYKRVSVLIHSEVADRKTDFK